jgi:uncharacterized phage protein (TIGR02220 family)
MNTDIRISISFKGNRKRKKFRLLLRHDSATDYLLDFWLSVATDRPDGDLAGLDNLDICLMAGWEGDCEHFVDCLVSAGFLDIKSEGYSVHDWAEHNGWASAAKQRSEVARKAAISRWEKKSGIKAVMPEQCLSNTEAMPQHEISNAPSPSPIPSPSPNPNHKEEKTIVRAKKPVSLSAPVSKIVDHLNLKTGSTFKANSKVTRGHISARLAEGFEVEDFFSVIDHKADEWKTDAEMSQYLRPQTLFGTKFEAYLQVAKIQLKGAQDVVLPDLDKINCEGGKCEQISH